MMKIHLSLIEYRELNKTVLESMGTYLLENKYLKTVPMTKFVMSGDKQLEQSLINLYTNNLENMRSLEKRLHHHIVDIMFGLYSTYELLLS